MSEIVHSSSVRLERTRTRWLSCIESGKEEDRYLLIEDEETGDVLMPLVYMKNIFEANYSRKLSSLKHRVVITPGASNISGASKNTLPVTGKRKKIDLERQVYWVWAFEAPQDVKAIVRQILGEEKVPPGHLRLVLIPIVYNAMVKRPQMRDTPFFRALHTALKASTYYPLLENPAMAEDELVATVVDCDPEMRDSFKGPHSLATTLAKYTIPFEAAKGTDISKRARAVAQHAAESREDPDRSVHGSAGNSALEAAGHLARDSADRTPTLQQPHGPAAVQPIAAWWGHSYDSPAVQEYMGGMNGASIFNDRAHGAASTGPQLAAPREPVPREGSALPSQGHRTGLASQELCQQEIARLQRDHDTLGCELKRLRTDCEANLSSVYLELFNLRHWVMEVSQKLLGTPPNSGS
ncbi:hypothetical protein CYMTET_18587 [Cymbomonas tetramitiformis]|uniref:Uncharacterized protein n=1 Tax=Cymbomonas tetramitiformis TaxID=36881 RepID=A0AAE0G7T6_9CHLO|nr:hypothetical protein CYMTET_18587 [Cymbomonas tetramitiformis]